MGRKPDADNSGRETIKAVEGAGPSTQPATNGPRRIKGKRTRTGESTFGFARRGCPLLRGGAY